jgi:flagellar basal-body rod protein FlgF
MDAGIYAAVSGSLAAQVRLEAIANNLANASTPGFKAERFVQWVDPVAAEATPGVTAAPIARGRLETDFSQGPLEATGNALDVALSGPGFLVVETARGERLTRRGALAVDPEGYLTTGDGLRVQGEGGDLRVGGGPLAIAPDGTVRAGAARVGALRIVTVREPGALVREGGTLFAPGGEALAEAAPGEVRVVQRALEGANVSPVESLVALIDTLRGFEAYVHAAERLDQAAARAIGDVGRV